MLRQKPFGRLWLSYSLNETGDVLGAVALAILVFDQTGDPLATAALFVATRFLPAFVAPVLTARVDQGSMRATLGALYVLEAVCFAVLAVLASNFVLVPVLLLGILDGTLALTARGLTRGLVARTLPDEELLRSGNALINISFAFATVAGAALAGFFVDEFGAEVALWLDAASFALVALLMATCRTLPTPEEDDQEPFRMRLRGGLAFVRGEPAVRTLLSVQALALVLFTLVVPIEVVYVKETLDAGDVGLGILMASWGVGMVLGSAAFARARSIAPMSMVVVSTGLVGVAYLGMGLTAELVLASGFSVLGGVGNGMQWVSVMTLLQRGTPMALQARVTGLLESLGAAMPGIGFLLGGVLASVFDAQTTYLVAGVGVFAVVAVIAAVTPRRRPAAPSGGA